MRRASVWILAVTVLALVAAGCSRGPSDEAIATDIKARMFSDAQLKNANLQVTAKNGEVTLAGEVPSDSARYNAFKLAAETKGVVKVHDLLTVQAAQAAARPAPATSEPAPAPKPAPIKKVVKRAPAPALVAVPALPPPSPAPAPVAAAAPPPAPAPAPVVSPPPPAEPKPVKVEIPVGTTLAVRMIDSIDSEVNRTGETFRASLDAPIMIEGEEVVPAGTDVSVRLAEAKTAGHMAGRSELRLEVSWFEFQGKRYTVDSSTYEQVGSSRGKNTAAKVGTGAAIGAIIGAIAGGGKGAAIGATVGAGAGAGAQVFTKGQQIRVPSETRIDFRLDQPIVVTYMPGQNNNRRRNYR
ncbi:MAG: BON domain-containing protein [Acidobacteria bacterium]|nr:BON domain-containing protein [Acidobacteriota bacterium]MBI3662254.1 BON domain-containing protein [Acidobacteriota bacterium]